MKKIFLAGLFILLATTGMFRYAICRPGISTHETIVLINRGETSLKVAQKLFAAGVVQHPLLFRLAARWQGLDKYLKAGEYAFAAEISIADVINQLARGETLYRKLTLPEGLTTAQMLEIIRQDEFLEGAINVQPAEGELLPETYSFSRGDSRDSIVLRAQKAMQKALEEEWQKRASDLPIETAHELLILASIVEKETGLAEERGRVASVFVNRLRKGMRLQTDPTVIYALTKGQKDLKRALTRKDLDVDSPYNTYKYYGLPPAPICNPGLAALQAAARPEETDYLYFVASGNGGHNFATSLNAHNQNVGQWKKHRRGMSKYSGN